MKQNNCSEFRDSISSVGDTFLRNELAAQSQDELFDVVDDNDEIVGRSSRGEVHRLGLLHRAVHVFVMNSAGEFLLQRRSFAKDVDPNKLTSGSSGHLDAGESYIDAAVRELREEVGIIRHASTLKKIAKIPPSTQTGYEWVELYLIVHDGDLSAAPNEVSALEWSGLQELKARIKHVPTDFAEGFMPCFNAFLNWHERPEVVAAV